MKNRLCAAFFVLAVALAGVLGALFRRDLPLEVLREAYADEASRFVDVGGLEIHYKDEGRGPTIVLLHGFGSSLHTWDGWVDELRADFRLIRLDLPGHGLTGPNAAHDYRTETYVRMLGRFVDRVGVDRFALAGNSMGGGISWLFTARHPERVERLVLIDASGAPRTADAPSGARHSGGSSVMRFVRLPVIDRLVTRFTPRFLFEKALLEVYADDTLVTGELVDRHYQLALRPGNRAALAARLSSQGGDHRDLIASLRQPTLVMWGRQDTWIPVSHAERFHAALPDSELVIYDDVGHLPMEEAPRRSAAEVRRFLSSTPASPRGEARTAGHRPAARP